MISRRLETIFVGDIAQGDGSAIGIGITERSLNVKSVLLAIFNFDKLAMFLRPDAVSNLIVVVVRAVRARSVNMQQSQIGDQGTVRFQYGKRKHCGYATKYDDLEKILCGRNKS